MSLAVEKPELADRRFPSMKARHEVSTACSAPCSPRRLCRVSMAGISGCDRDVCLDTELLSGIKTAVCTKRLLQTMDGVEIRSDILNTIARHRLLLINVSDLAHSVSSSLWSVVCLT